MPIDLRLDPGEVALLTDLYELTVSAAFFEHGFNDVASFEVDDAPDAGRIAASWWQRELSG